MALKSFFEEAANGHVTDIKSYLKQQTHYLKTLSEIQYEETSEEFWLRGSTATVAGGPAPIVLENRIGRSIELVSFSAALATPLTSNSGLSLIPSGITIPYSQSNTGAASAFTVTSPATAGLTSFITGFTITGGGATAASVIVATITGITNTLSFDIAVPAGVTAGITPLVVTFPEPIPATAANVAIVLNVPSFGAGNTNEAATINGFQQGSIANPAVNCSFYMNSVEPQNLIWTSNNFSLTVSDKFYRGMIIPVNGTMIAQLSAGAGAGNTFFANVFTRSVEKRTSPLPRNKATQVGW